MERKIIAIMAASTSFALGCGNLNSLGSKKGDKNNADATTCDMTELAYNGRIGGILSLNCLSCHGGSTAPDMTTYQGVVAVKDEALNNINTGHMPPSGVFSSDDDKAALSDWLAEEVPSEGKACKKPGAGGQTENAELPRVDHIVHSQVHTIDPNGEGDDNYDETVAFGLDAGKTYYITGVEVEGHEVDDDASGLSLHEGHEHEDSSQSPILHHLLVLDAAKGGTNGIITSNTAFNLFGGMVMGTAIWKLPEGYGIEAKGDMDFALSIHLNNKFSPEASPKIQIVIKFMLEPTVEHRAYLPLMVNKAWIINEASMAVPANEVTSLSYAFNPLDWVPSTDTTLDMFGVLYHMHGLGKAGKLEMTENGQTSTLNEDPKFNYANQFTHPFEEPIPVTANDNLKVTCTWDNTAANQPVIDGVKQQPRDVKWGEGTLDEMCMWVIPVGERKPL